MSDPTLRVMAWMVLCIDLLMLVGALVLSSVLIRYRHGITLWYSHIQRGNGIEETPEEAEIQRRA
jgi:hypothetical protein